jgi:hypothetical protein
MFRHTAGGDAFIMAQVFQRLMRAARRVGRNGCRWPAEGCDSFDSDGHSEIGGGTRRAFIAVMLER